ncbi:MAG: radical SAM protein [Nitrospirae bacterium]|nr:radical SAM protein [Nitrospirota bacterium]
MEVVDYQDFSFRLHNKAVSDKKRIPVNATIELTYRCNNRCVHCYCNLPESDREAEEKELTAEEIERIFVDLQQMGTLWLLITGGEPLLRQDFRDIYLSAKRQGFIVSLFTNATLVDDETVELLKRYPPFVVEVTMYGATKETYERVTRVRGSYERYWKGLQRLVQGGIKVRLKTMALTVNMHEIGMLERIAEELGCHFRFDPLVHSRIDNRKHSRPELYRISPEDVVRLDLAFPRRMQEYEQYCKKMVGKSMSHTDRLITCGAGRSSIHIMPDGRVLPCSMLINAAVSLREKSLREIWQVDMENILNRKRNFSLLCDSCSLINLCEQCPGWSFVEYHRLDRKVQYLCRIARKRAESFPFLK